MRTSRRQTMISVAFLLGAVCSLAAEKAAFVPGNETDKTAGNQAVVTEAKYVTPERLRFPYLSHYRIEPRVTTKDAVRIAYYVTDWDHRKVRFGDTSERFDVTLRYSRAEDCTNWKTLEQKGVPSGDGAFEFGNVAAKDAVTVGEEPCYILASGKTDSFAAAKTRTYPRERFPAMAKAVVAASADEIAKVELRCARMSLNFDGWNFLQLPLTSLSPVRIPSPGDDEWQWTRDGSGNGQIDFPIKVKSVTIGQMGRTLDLLCMKNGGDSVRIKSVELW